MEADLDITKNSILIASDSDINYNLISELANLNVAKIELLSTEEYLKNLNLENLKNTNFKIFEAKKIEYNPFSLEQDLKDKNCVITSFQNQQKNFLVSDACLELNIPLIYFGIYEYNFNIYPIIYRKSACLRCLEQQGLLIQNNNKINNNNFLFNKIIDKTATCLILIELIKIVTKSGITQGNEMINYNFYTGEINIIQGLDANLDCPDCG